MKIKPYDHTYLEDVSDNLGTMLEYAFKCGFNPIVIWEIFASSVVAREIEMANPKYLAGYSGRDYLDILVDTGPTNEDKLLAKTSAANDDRCYWAGWALARLQYECGQSFFKINRFFPIQSVLELYEALHEADIQKFIDLGIRRLKEKECETNLKTLRLSCGLTQAALATISQVDLRSIQMYEQRRNDINKAQADTLLKLSKTLHCKIEDLFEY